MKLTKTAPVQLLLCSIFGFIGIIFLVVGIAIGVNMVQGTITMDDGPLWILPVVFGGLGLTFTVAAAIILSYALRKHKKLNWLVENGLCFDAEITDAYFDYHIRYNGGHPMVVECSYHDRFGQNILVKSKHIFDSHICRIGNMNELHAIVYVHPDDPTNYYVAVERQYSANLDATIDLR